MPNLLPQLRRKHGIKQNDLARALTVSPSYLCKVENDVVEPSPSVKKRCSEFFGMDEEKIFPRSKTRNNDHRDEASAVHPLWTARRRRGIKQYELARQLDCSPSYLSKVEKGLQSPRPDFRKRCARVLKIKENELFP